MRIFVYFVAYYHNGIVKESKTPPDFAKHENLPSHSKYFVVNPLLPAMLGVVQKLCLQDFGFFRPPTPWVDNFYGMMTVDKKWTFLDHLPTFACKRILWTTPYLKIMNFTFIDSCQSKWYALCLSSVLSKDRKRRVKGL